MDGAASFCLKLESSGRSIADAKTDAVGVSVIEVFVCDCFNVEAQAHSQVALLIAAVHLGVLALGHLVIVIIVAAAFL
jgi:hypothetical protein